MTMDANNLTKFLLLAILLTGCTTETNEKPPLFTEEKFVNSVHDIFAEQLEEEPRFFRFNFGDAFNSSVGFTWPIISFNFPGGTRTSVPMNGTANQSGAVGVLGFVSLLLVGAIAAALYTTLQTRGVRGPRPLGPGSKRSLDSSIINYIYDSTEEIREALSFDNCMKLSVCEAYADPEKFWLLGLPLRTLIPIENGINISNFPEFHNAAIFGRENGVECDYRYPCLVKPLETLLNSQNYVI